MNRLKLLIAIVSLGFCVAGCAHKVTPEEIKAKAEQSANSGRSKFYEELAERKVVWYVYGGERYTGFNVQTGLPEVNLSSLPANMQTTEFAKAHNDAILEYIQNNASVPGSFLPWLSDLFHQAGFWARQQDVQTVKLDAPVTAPGGDYTLTLQRAGSAQGALQLVVKSQAGEVRASSPSGATEPSVDFEFGPTGSDLLFTRWPTGSEPVYAAMNLRDGKWLVVQQGQR